MGEYNTNILGDGTIGAGKYSNIKIMGDGTIVGDIECLNVIIMGDGEFKGGIEARDIKIMGDSTFHGVVNARELNVYGDVNLREKGNIEVLKVKGDLKSNRELEVKESINIMGDAEVEEDLTGKNIKVMGGIKIRKNLYFDTIKILGEMEVKGNCEGNYFYNKGEARIEGLLTADKIEIVPKRISKIEEIGGSEIIIKKTGWIDISGGKVISKLIEGDNIVLENTFCNVVRGHDITILGGCSIDKIEYTGKLTIDKNSKIGEEICLRN